MKRRSIEVDLRPAGERAQLQELTGSRAVAARFVLIAVPAIVTVYAFRVHNVPIPLTLSLSSGAIFLLGALRRPRWLFSALFGMGWLGQLPRKWRPRFLQDPNRMRWVMAAVGLLLLLFGIAYPFIWLASGTWV